MPPKFRRDYAGPDRELENKSLLDGASDDDDFFLKGPRPSVPSSRALSGNGTDKIQRLQGDVSEVVDIMQTNITRVIERGDRLEDLQDKSEYLSSNSEVFRSRARGLHHHMWWKECRMRIIIGVVVIIVLIIIIVPIIVQTQKNKT